MAAQTAASVVRDSAGSLTVHKFTFTSVADSDTFASGLPNVVNFIAQGNGNPATQASAGVDVTQSSGTFTFYPGEDSLGLILTTWSRT